jgi:hypothetical protein
MTDLKLRRKAPRVDLLRFILSVLTVALVVAALAPWIGMAAGYVIDRQIAVWDAQQASHQRMLVSE